MKTLYIYHHLGLGDHIICNGLARHYATLYDKIYVFCKPHNVDNVSYMYKDRANIKILPLNDSATVSYIAQNKQNNYLIIGFDDLLKTLAYNPKITFDFIFYDMAYIPFEYKWEKFYLDRDIEREKDVFYNKLRLKDTDEFIFLHDDIEKNRSIIKQYPENIKIIRPDNKSISIFDFLYTIGKAKEVHCINSCFLNLIDCVQLRNNGLFFHRYTNFIAYGEQITPVLKMDWRVIN